MDILDDPLLQGVSRVLQKSPPLPLLMLLIPCLYCLLPKFLPQ
jgi:hypothetical protein